MNGPVTLSHTSLRPVRDLMPEQVFAAEWLALMTASKGYDDPDYDGPENGYKLTQILSNKRAPITDRCSRVAASIIVWFGTNCGNCFLIESRKLAAAHVGYPFVAKWGTENIRFTWLNGGITTIEHCCATEYQDDRFGMGGRQVVRPKLSADDYETAVHLMVWLGTDEGLAFITECERKIKVRDEIARLGLSERSLSILGVSA